ncbi:hypothetical protein BFN03_11750 [Rhodococcus sp. WMMA185]|uniref:DUF2182 domain-containing protein n=1 Tax=Rhodococcus sp. WMMA185 TaxID=679318 RepID=UPI000878C56C|nr:DUF2182 domain-containing protein [Rhodococcus sp. WMMA185]AOW94863.1 hypothetical protein BFN03_11750 [Rhodococcus sp. WMMA185]
MAQRDTSGTVRDVERWPLGVSLSYSLLVVAALGWWWTVVGAGHMESSAMATMSFAAFLVAWIAMMAAMMLPAILPVVRLYALAAARGAAAPVAVFVGGYLVVWSAVGVPAYLLWRRLSGPLAQASPGAARFAGAVAIGAAVYQLTPLKSLCLKRCRSPLSFFLHHGRHLDRPAGAALAGGRHGVYCLGCCWMLMVLLVALGTMSLGWMIALAVLILLEKTAPFGEVLTRVAAAGLLILGAALLLQPALIGNIV